MFFRMVVYFEKNYICITKELVVRDNEIVLLNTVVLTFPVERKCGFKERCDFTVQCRCLKLKFYESS